MMRYVWLLFAIVSLPLSATEIEVKMLANGSALLAIDGKQRMLRVGNVSPEGVKLIAADGKKVEVEVNGKRETLGLNRRIATQFKKADKAEVRIASSRGGHYVTPGRINGMPVQFMVDTGATSIAMNHHEAERLGIDYRAGEPITVSTANGRASAYQILLDRVAVGDIELNQVLAVVSSSDSPEIILLGNSYLGKVDLSVDKGVLLLKAKH